ncbi:type VII toxin-antitoxin system MntA family adenylyltransferase antitoxin [Parathalassolituus penaei]|uniref:Nucleotidyltransferase domain-containing protein n=1 Tax=Parathalassolituus penaei TaxID=2997323 RepID=A0A9X3EJB1_9GAMM|nr:nucleotidyltransferase domain-containing protein [Parathalassolituus penaei]MCY0965311.1 nucleotidyltransferase domain-containing protein [Parathalassolituus penaei]
MGIKHLTASLLATDLVAFLRQQLSGCLAVYVFGSRATGEAGLHSDLDIAVLVEGYAEPLQLWNLASDLAIKAGCDVDLLDLRAATTVMQFQVLQTGICLWSQQPAAGIYEAFVLSEKTSLNELRADLLKDIQQRGSIYGR